jgi:hypothetical protein
VSRFRIEIDRTMTQPGAQISGPARTQPPPVWRFNIIDRDAAPVYVVEQGLAYEPEVLWPMALAAYEAATTKPGSSDDTERTP